VTFVRVLVGLLAVVGVAAVIGSALRTIVIPGAVPARLARLAFLAVQWMLRLRLRLTGRADYATRNEILALQAPIGLFTQLFLWSLLIYLMFAVLFWALSGSSLDGQSISRGLELSGSSLLTLGFDRPSGLVRQLTAFAAAGVGLVLLALVITYLPTVYGAFSRREALVTKLTVRTGPPSSGLALLSSSWALGNFDQLEHLWNAFEDWFIDVGESHTSFPQLSWFRSAHAHNHWVLASEAVLDGSALFITACDVPRQSRSELCLHAGVHALMRIGGFLGIEHRPPEAGATIALSEDQFRDGCAELHAIGVPVVEDRDAAWTEFQAVRARYEPLLTVLGRMTDAPRSDWSSWSDATPLHRPPLLGMRHKRSN
jgi:hypothetical protein